MPLGIDPKVDFAFKLVFGSPDHTSITIHFLNAVLQLPEPIEWVEILNPIQGKDRSEDKLVVLDVLAKDRLGRMFNIEMQTSLPVDLPKRLTYYNCINYVRQLHEGERYQELRPAISICVLNRTLFAQTEAYHLSFRLRCDQESLVFTDDLEIHTLELPKFRCLSDNTEELSAMEKWIYFLQHAEEMEADELSRQLGESAYKEAAGVLTMISRNPEDRQFYEARMKFLHDEEARLIAARQEGELVGRVKLLSELLGESTSGVEDMTQEALSNLEADLQRRLRERQA